MRKAKKPIGRREGFTLIELIVVITIILAIAALAAAFAPRVSDSTNLTRAVDQTSQWLLTAKMRAKRDGLATGIRFIQMPGDTAGYYSQFQYIQQPDSLSGSPGGGVLQSAGGGVVTLSNVDVTMGATLPPTQYLVQAGDYLEVRDGGVYFIAGATSTSPPPPTPPVTTIHLASTTGYDAGLTITTPTSNYRIIRQPRILIGEDPLVLPNNFAVDATLIPDTIIPNNSTTTKIPWSIVAPAPNGSFDIVFSPSGAIVGANAGSGKVLLTVYDMTIKPVTPLNIDHLGIIAVQSRTGFIGAYSVAPGADPFALAESGRESGL